MACDFTATSGDYLIDTSATGFDTTAADFTITFWLKADVISGVYTALQTYEAATGDNAIQIRYGSAAGGWSEIRTWHNWASSFDSTGSALSTGTWYFFAIVYTDSSPGGTYNVYVNDMATADMTTAQAGDMSADVNQIGFGATVAGGEPSDGRIAYARFWNRALSESERNTEKGSNAACLTTSLISDWQMTSGATLGADSYGSNTLTAGGNAAYSSDEPSVSGCGGGAAISVITRHYQTLLS